jgi:hypothetical protein
MARDKLARMKRNDYPYPDNDIIVIPRGGNPGSARVHQRPSLLRSRASKRSTARRGRQSSSATTARSRRR